MCTSVIIQQLMGVRCARPWSTEVDKWTNLGACSGRDLSVSEEAGRGLGHTAINWEYAGRGLEWMESW